jgi:hypothetical protein
MRLIIYEIVMCGILAVYTGGPSYAQEDSGTKKVVVISVDGSINPSQR